MKLFTVRLTGQERAVLEAARKRMGLRSEAEVIRRWIAEADIVPSDHPSKPQWTAEEAAAIKRAARETINAAKLYEPGRSLRISSDLPTSAVQLGAPKPTPGSRLKPEKGAKR